MRGPAAEAFGSAVSYHRGLRGWSQADLSDELAGRGIWMRQSAISLLESGKKSTTLDQAWVLAEVFDTTIDAMLGKPSAPSPFRDVARLTDDIEWLQGELDKVLRRFLEAR